VSGFASRRPALSLHGAGATAGGILLFIYVTVTSILLGLTWISRCTRERLYFAFCATGASMGLLRIWFGDVALPVAQYLRVLMLLCAVVTGTMILRSFGPELAPDENS
jgi:hypothetical protein